MKDLMKLVNECMSELNAIGVKYGNVTEWKVNYRAKTRWGLCKKHYSEYTIEITNELLADNLSDKPAKETIFHELIHTCKGCMNHGTEWQKIANLVNDCYGYNIKRATSSEEKGVDLKANVIYKYQYKCSKCGQIVRKTKACRFTREYTEYGCGICKNFGTFEMI